MLKTEQIRHNSTGSITTNRIDLNYYPGRHLKKKESDKNVIFGNYNNFFKKINISSKKKRLKKNFSLRLIPPMILPVHRPMSEISNFNIKLIYRVGITQQAGAILR